MYNINVQYLLSYPYKLYVYILKIKFMLIYRNNLIYLLNTQVFHVAKTRGRSRYFEKRALFRLPWLADEESFGFQIV